MPNTGRSFAPQATAAAYRDRYMRPYATVSAPLGGAGLSANAMAAGPPKGAYYGRTNAAMRRQGAVDSEDLGAYSSAYEGRARARPAATYEDDRQWPGSYTEKQQFTRPRTWSQEQEDVSVHRGAPLSTSVDLFRSMEMSRTHRVAAASNYGSGIGMPSHAPMESNSPQSTLPRLSSLLKRSPSEAETYDSDKLFVARKRVRDVSPMKDDYRNQTKMSRRFYEDNVFTDRRSPMKDPDEAWHSKDVHSLRRDLPMPMKNAGSHINVAQPSATQFHQSSSLPISCQAVDRSRYSYMNEEAHVPTNSVEYPRRSNVREHMQSTFRNDYEALARKYETTRRSYYPSVDQRSESSPVGLHSPTPTSVLRDRFSPVGRYSDSKEGDCVIEAAADLVEERSPSKRESITKLLLKSKEFLKAKSLVRNRNNEIDWVATFLNVGFESNSIYSLMCPLRKGRWKVEEEKYTMELLRLIESGVIRLRHGQSIRGFIAKKLHSDDMRVLKKLSNCKMFHFARLINPRMSDEEEIDNSIPNVRVSLDRLEKLKAEFLRSVQLEALVAVRKYLSDTSIRDLLNARD